MTSQDRIDKAINDIKSFNTATQTITATGFKDLVYYAKKAIPGMTKELLDIPSNERDSAWQNLYWTYGDQFNQIKSNIQKANEVLKSTTNTAIKTIITNYLAKANVMLPIADKLKAIKLRIAKKETKAVAKLRNFEQIKGKLNSVIKDELEKIAENFRVGIEQNFNNYYHNILKRYIKDSTEKDITNPYQLYGRDDEELKYDLIKLLQRKTTGQYIILSNVEQHINDISKSNSIAVIKNFIFKMYDKLGGLLADIDKPATIESTGSNYKKNQMEFKFDDGGQFTLQNNIVLSQSKYGKPFYRYPTTFHGIILPNGNKVNNPSELELKKAFNKVYSESIKLSNLIPTK